MDKKDMKNQRPPKPKMDMKILGRVMGYIFRNYKYRMFFESISPKYNNASIFALTILLF